MITSSRERGDMVRWWLVHATVLTVIAGVLGGQIGFQVAKERFSGLAETLAECVVQGERAYRYAWQVDVELQRWNAWRAQLPDTTVARTPTEVYTTSYD